MTTISDEAVAAREAARRHGQFGTQPHSDSGQVQIAPQYDPIRFSFDGMPETTFPAMSYGQTWNGWETPIVDKATMEELLTFSEQTFAWDGDTAVIENQEGDPERYDPLPDGTYDTADLGWTLCRVQAGDLDCRFCGQSFDPDDEELAEEHERSCFRNDEAPDDK